MKETSRTKNALRNSIVGILSKAIAILGGYLTRILLVRVVPPELVGLNGLFFTILGGLVLSDMGLDTAMAYALFQPVAEGDLARQRALLKLYRRIYLCFSGAILLLGLCVYAFLPVIVREELDWKTVSLVYFLFLLNTILSYQCVSRRTLIFALQKDYVNDLFASGFWILQYASQCLILLLTGSFPLFLLAGAVCTGLKNLSITVYARRRYPFPREPSAPVISGEEKKALAGNIRAMLLHKSGSVIINNTDNILLSAEFGISTVASYSNYTLIVGSVHQLFARLINGISAGVGNIGVTESKEQAEVVFGLVLFGTCWLFGVGAAALFILLDPFIRLSFGGQYLLPRQVVFLLCLNFYLNGVRRASLVFRDSLGLFRQDRYKTLAEGIVNLIASLFFASRMGIAGILAGTTFSYLSISLWVEPLVLYREFFRKPTGGYFKKLLLYSLAVAAADMAAWAVCRLIPDISLWSFLGKAGLCALVTNGLLFLAARKRPEFRTLIKALRNR